MLSNYKTIEEVSKLLELKVSYIYKLTSTNKIPYVKPFGKNLYFDIDQIDAFISKSRVATTQEIQTKVYSSRSQNSNRC